MAVNYAKGEYLGRTPTTAAIIVSSQTVEPKGRGLAADSSGIDTSQTRQPGGVLQLSNQIEEDVPRSEATELRKPDAYDAVEAPQAAPGFANQHVQDQQPASLVTKQLEQLRKKRKRMLPLDCNNTILHYEAIDKIGSGGLASVFSARDKLNGKRVALKVSTEALYVLQDDQGEDWLRTQDFFDYLHKKSWDFRCFRHEIDTYNHLGCHDPSITQKGLPQVMESGLVILSDRRVHTFIVMSLLGDSVFEEIQTERLKNDRVHFSSVAHGMLQALHHMHKQGYVHRDVKPGNFCLPCYDMADPRPTCFIVDFGFARRCPTIRDKPKQDFEGTPDYAPVAALKGEIQGPCHDLEALAYALVEVWTGTVPWDVTNPATWSTKTYTDMVMRTYNREKACGLASRPREQRPAVSWEEDNLNTMAKYRQRDWSKNCNSGSIPRFLILWVRRVMAYKAHHKLPESLYMDLHNLIDEGVYDDMEEALGMQLASQSYHTATSQEKCLETQETCTQGLTQSQRPVKRRRGLVHVGPSQATEA